MDAHVSECLFWIVGLPPTQEITPLERAVIILPELGVIHRKKACIARQPFALFGRSSPLHLAHLRPSLLRYHDFLEWGIVLAWPLACRFLVLEEGLIQFHAWVTPLQLITVLRFWASGLIKMLRDIVATFFKIISFALPIHVDAFMVNVVLNNPKPITIDLKPALVTCAFVWDLVRPPTLHTFGGSHPCWGLVFHHKRPISKLFGIFRGIRPASEIAQNLIHSRLLHLCLLALICWLIIALLLFTVLKL